MPYPTEHTHSSKKRNVYLEAVRVIAMFLVVMVHMAGIRLKNEVQSDVLWALSFCAVNVFGLLSGYVGLGSHHRLSRFVELWL